MFKRISALCLVVVMLMALGLAGCQSGAGNTTASTGAADNSLQKIKDKGELVLGLDDAFPPMGFRDDKNEIVGFDIDLAKEVCKRMGITLKLQPVEWSQIVNELNAGQIDCIWNGYSITPSRQTETNITDPYMKNHQVVVVLADSSFKTLADLAGKTLTLQAESSAADALEKAADFKASLKEVVELDDNVMAMQDLDAKASDAILLDEIVANYYIKNKDAKYRILDETLADEDYGVGFRKADQTLRDEVEKTMKAMAADGTMAKISETWFGKDITTIGK